MFVPQKQIKTALGTFKNKEEREYFEKMSQLFAPMGMPRPQDWLYSHKEKHQSFADYKPPNYNPVTPSKKTIYMLPFGQFDTHFLKTFISFCEVFYPGMIVKCMPVVDLKKLKNASCRPNQFGRDQYYTEDILEYMKEIVPKDAYCVTGITLEDIYPGKNWKFVYGWAKFKARVGIFSFTRWDMDYTTGKKKSIDFDLILFPSMRVMVHQIGHMFGITHCVYYRCLMNGTFNPQEHDFKRLEFCPICFRKILSNIGFDRVKRYQKLIQFCENNKIEKMKLEEDFYRELLQLSSASEEMKLLNIVKPKTGVIKTKVKILQSTTMRKVEPSKLLWEREKFNIKQRGLKGSMKKKEQIPTKEYVLSIPSNGLFARSFSLKR